MARNPCPNHVQRYPLPHVRRVGRERVPGKTTWLPIWRPLRCCIYAVKENVGNISPSVHLSKSKPGEYTPVRKMSPSCPLGYPHLVDNSICFPHSYPQYVDNLAFFDFLIHIERIRACRASAAPAMRRILDNLSAILFVKWHRYYGFPVHHTSKSWRSMAESNSWNNGLDQGQNRGFQAMAVLPEHPERPFATLSSTVCRHMTTPPKWRCSAACS